MTYLATEMLLYLLSAAVIGLALGWLIWGSGQRRKLRALRNDLMATLEMERETHKETALQLNDAERTRKAAVEEANAEAERSLTELRQIVDAERLAAQESQSALEKMRAETDEAIEAGRTSGQEAVDQAMRTANAEKAAAADAMAKEAQSRAQIEELRLLIGAEKLAAESARTELEQVRSELETKLETERAAHEQAKLALDDIRSTLSRTLGPAALGIAGATGDADDAPYAASEPAGPGGGAGLTGEAAGSAAASDHPSTFSMMTDMAIAGEALNNPDLDEADIEDREDMSLDLSPAIDTEQASDQFSMSASDPGVNEPNEAADPTPTTDRIALRPLPLEAEGRARPSIFSERRPDDVDDLQAIEGISPEIEQRLHAAGCYRYRQLAELAPKDVDWLAGEIDVTTDQIAADRWMDQARSLIGGDPSDEGPIFLERTDRENAAG
ncbi:MAG: hypothetical protein ACR2RA_08495 [Geminicoccaceae bacterium]